MDKELVLNASVVQNDTQAMESNAENNSIYAIEHVEADLQSWQPMNAWETRWMIVFQLRSFRMLLIFQCWRVYIYKRKRKWYDICTQNKMYAGNLE